MPAQKKTETERARVRKQVAQEKAGIKRAPARDEALPEVELQTIIDLLDAGKTREAKQHLDDFRKRYPGVEIPEALTRRLEPLNARWTMQAFAWQRTNIYCVVHV